MKKFVYKLVSRLITYLLLIFCILAILEVIIWNNVSNTQYLLQADWHIKRNYTNKVLFIGNSRTWVHVDVKEFSSQTQVKAYSLAQNGRGSEVLWYKFIKYMENNPPPELIYLQFDPTFTIIEGLQANTFYGKENYLSYLFLNNLKINKNFSKERGYNGFEQYVPLIRYIGYKDLFIRHLLKHDKIQTKNPESDYRLFEYGSNPSKWLWGNIKESRWNTPNKTIGKLNFQYIDSFVTYCRQNSIELNLIYPPQSYPSYGKVSQSLIDTLNNYSKRKNIPFKNFNSPSYNDSTMFYMHIHLNTKGAKQYTNELIHHYDSLTKAVPILND